MAIGNDNSMCYELMKEIACANLEFQAYFGSPAAVELFFNRFEKMFPGKSVNRLKEIIDGSEAYSEPQVKALEELGRKVFPEMGAGRCVDMFYWFDENIVRISGNDYRKYTGCMAAEDGDVLVPAGSRDMGSFDLNGKRVLVRETDSMYDNRYVLNGIELFSVGPYCRAAKLEIRPFADVKGYELLVVPCGYGRVRLGFAKERDFKTFDVYADNGVRLFEKVDSVEVVNRFRISQEKLLAVVKDGKEMTYSCRLIKNMASNLREKALGKLSKRGVGKEFREMLEKGMGGGLNVAEPRVVNSRKKGLKM